MKTEQFAAMVSLLPADNTTIIVRKQPDLYGFGFVCMMTGYAKKRSVECVTVDMSYQDGFFLHELKELVEYRKGREFVCVFDFTSGCDLELKKHLLRLLINRKYNGFALPETVKVVIYDNIGAEAGYDNDGFDPAMYDKCTRYTVEA